ncbi:hypothetical protein O0L34_g9346 [Tuta absoluta]|nr:hypothetical protein O0L34_g9346 [Tuta absoluta]
MSPTAAVPPPSTETTERTELLGSLTTQQQQRTSARVIKKLRLEPLPDKDKRDLPDCETPNKIDDKDPVKFPTVKHRMPKALWSTDEKNLFFEALNEYGKDFDAITAYICAKMKKKGMADVNLKTKTQVSHFYYRTWHKLSKHVQFDENVKKVAQELYALINYGELRKKLVSVNEKTCARLGEMVLGGSMVIRARGRNVRVRTPMCRALRKLNQITERACGLRVCSRAQVVLRARDAAAWSRVQAAAHNPRAAASLPLRTSLAAFIAALQKRWAGARYKKVHKIIEPVPLEDCAKEIEEMPELRLTPAEEEEKQELEEHLHLETDRIIVQEQKLPKKPVLHVGPRPTAQIHIPTISPSEQLSSQKICFSSYLERVSSQRDKDSGAKIRTPKRQRKDSTTDPKDSDPKKIKLEDDPVKTFGIVETAIDGIELMASYRHSQDDDEKPSTEDEKDLKLEDIVEEEAEILDNNEKDGVEKDVTDKDLEREKDLSEKEKDSFSELEDDEKYNKSESDNESDHGKEIGKERKFKNLKVKFRIRPKKRGGTYVVVVNKDQDETKDESQKEPLDETKFKPDFDLDMAIKQVQKGWSVFDAGDLTIGDLYLMFGSRSKLDLDYWWAEPTPPLPRKADSVPPACLDKDKKEKADKTPDKDGFVEDKESDSDILFSPKNAFSQDSNDGLSGDERKSEQLASPEHKSSSSSNSFKLANKLINRPAPAANTQENGFSLLSDRLKRLLALVGNTHVGPGAAAIARCTCGHVCAQQRRTQQKQGCIPAQCTSQGQPRAEDNSAVFRHPTPIAPKCDIAANKVMSLEGIPRWRRGRPRIAAADRRVVVQRLLPLLPKLPPPSNLIPVKIVPNSPPPPPRILPKPPPTSTSDLSFFYVLSESNGQFFFHDGDRRIPITPLPTNNDQGNTDIKDEDLSITEDVTLNIVSVEQAPPSAHKEQQNGTKPDSKATDSADNPDIANFLPSDSMSLSPSRLLRDADGWPESAVQDFSLSSFLGHLDGRPEPDAAVDSHLQSLMAESSVDYVAKFADLAAEVSDDRVLPPDHLP